jgi:hypothetical protein
VLYDNKEGSDGGEQGKQIKLKGARQEVLIFLLCDRVPLVALTENECFQNVLCDKDILETREKKMMMVV